MYIQRSMNAIQKYKTFSKGFFQVFFSNNYKENDQRIKSNTLISFHKRRHFMAL